MATSEQVNGHLGDLGGLEPQTSASLLYFTLGAWWSETFVHLSWAVAVTSVVEHRRLCLCNLLVPGLGPRKAGSVLHLS